MIEDADKLMHTLPRLWLTFFRGCALGVGKSVLGGLLCMLTSSVVQRS